MLGRNLLIVGAGIYGLVASEIALDMGCFDKIDFVDDSKQTAGNGKAIVGTTNDLENLALSYSDIVVAIGNPNVRIALMERIKKTDSLRLTTLISPRAYISPTARISLGCIIEPFAVVHSNCTLDEGCILSAGSVVNHASICGKAVHVDCNATVTGMAIVPIGAHIKCGEIYS